MGLLGWVMVALAVWHFTIWLPDRCIGGIVGALGGSLIGAVLVGLLLHLLASATFGIPGSKATNVAVVLYALPGAALGIAVMYLLGVARERPAWALAGGHQVGAVMPSASTLGAAGGGAAVVAPASLRLGSRGLRLLAQIIDGLVIVVPVVVTSLISGSYTVGGVLYLAMALLYAPLLLARSGQRNGQTIGKQLLGLRVILGHDYQQAIGFGRGCTRELAGRTLPNVITLGLYGLIDSLWCLFDRQRRTLHDRIAGTVVVSAITESSSRS